MLLLLGKERINEGWFLSQHWKHSKAGIEFAKFPPGPLPPPASSFSWVTAQKAFALGFPISFSSPGEPTA